ncbi:MAG: PQQ-binding-like beta-propeller repeat protein [Alphaproteobacteria bacterium]|nr:PQQ-binding-like beta-propeller repeat protein [Alphaproteobacteria bacterium]
MKRRDFAGLLLASLLPAGCSWFKDKKTPLPGERISVLGLDRNLEPDPKLAETAVKLPAPVVNPDWPEPGGYPNHAMYHLALPEKLGRVWEAGIGEGSGRYTRVMSQPVIAKGRVYAMDGGVQLSAFDAANGHRFWQVDLKPEDQRGNAFGGGPAVWNDRLFVSTGYAEVLALDPGNGKVIWRRTISGPVHSPPTVSDGRIFVVTVDNELNVLAAEDGRHLWTHNAIPETAGLLGSASPAVEGEIAVVAYNSGELYALRVENGRPVWSDNLASTRSVDAVSSLADIRGRPVVDRGRVFAISHSGRMAAIDQRSGDRVWEQEIASTHGPWVAGDYVFVLANDNQVVCLTRNEGGIRWVRQLQRYQDEKEKSDPIRWAGPVLGGDRLIVLSSNGEALSISPYTGEPLGRTQVSAGGYLGPVIADNSLYLLTDDANLSAYR